MREGRKERRREGKKEGGRERGTQSYTEKLSFNSHRMGHRCTIWAETLVGGSGGGRGGKSWVVVNVLQLEWSISIF